MLCDDYYPLNSFLVQNISINMYSMLNIVTILIFFPAVGKKTPKPSFMQHSFKQCQNKPDENLAIYIQRGFMNVLARKINQFCCDW